MMSLDLGLSHLSKKEVLSRCYTSLHTLEVHLSRFRSDLNFGRSTVAS